MMSAAPLLSGLSGELAGNGWGWLGLAIALGLIGVTLTQLVLVWWFDRICRAAPALPPAHALPLAHPLAPPHDASAAARVILCLRGGDPFLEATLAAITRQDHPSYELVIVIDSLTDPAWPIVERFRDRHETSCPITVTPLATRPHHCSLKCASLLQGLADMPASIKTVALLDADVVPPPHWLRTISETLSDETWAVTGNRWYVPPDQELGSWTRLAWNAGALVQMVCFGIPWGGSLGLHRDLVDQPILRQAWATAFCEDTSLPRVLRRLGKRCRFLPALIAVNRESVTLSAFLPWVSRQLLTARLYHPAWLLVFPFGLAAPALVVLASLAAAVAVTQGWYLLAVIEAAAIAAFLVSLPGLVWWIEAAARRGAPGVFQADDQPVSRSWWRLIVGIAVAQAAYPRCLWEAQTMRQCDWRGVRYAINPGARIEVLHDAAAANNQPSDRSHPSNHSLS